MLLNANTNFVTSLLIEMRSLQSDDRKH